MTRSSVPRPREAGSPGTRPPVPASDGAAASTRASQPWTLLTSHGRVLLLIARNPELKVREIADLARITERAASGITADLEAAGYITKEKSGRRTTYLVHHDVAFRHAAEADHSAGELIDIFVRHS